MGALSPVQHLAAAVERPTTEYLRDVGRAQVAIAGVAGEAARQLGMFVDRVGELGPDELGELYEETFERGVLAGLGPLGATLRGARLTNGEARAAIDTLAARLRALDADRNPYAYVVRALCCLLLAELDAEIPPGSRGLRAP